MMLPLSKTLDPADFDQLAEELAIVDQSFTKDREQHPMRRWEYAMALRAQQIWYDAVDRRPQGPIVDVGGAGSPFWRMINPEVCRVIDPDGGADLAETLRLGASLASEVYCLSVLEHVDDLDRFLYHLSCLVAPGGLLFLTVDYCDGAARTTGSGMTFAEVAVPDTYHFHWMRKRIFNVYLIRCIRAICERRDFNLLGEADYAWHGPTVYDYTFASLALVKRP